MPPGPYRAISRALVCAMIRDCVGFDRNVNSAFTSRAACTHRGSCRLPRPGATERIEISPGSPRAVYSLIQRSSVRLGHFISLHLALTRSPLGRSGRYCGRGSPGSGNSGLPDLYPVSTSRMCAALARASRRHSSDAASHRTSIGSPRSHVIGRRSSPRMRTFAAKRTYSIANLHRSPVRRSSAAISGRPSPPCVFTIRNRSLPSRKVVPAPTRTPAKLMLAT